MSRDRFVTARTRSGFRQIRCQARAAKRVAQPLPPPRECRYCRSPVELIHGELVYRTQPVKWPYLYSCSECGARVGTHPQTDIPLGTLANRELRALRMAAKQEFQRFMLDRMMPRRMAYLWLSKQLEIPVSQCHFGWFDIEECNRAMHLLRFAPIKLKPVEVIDAWS